MFVECFSGEVVDEAYWPASFYFENTIRAILVEDGMDLCGLSPMELKAELLRIGHDLGFPDRCPDPQPPAAWVADFFDRECPNLVGFLNEVRKSRVAEIDPALPGISANQKRLQECMRHSKEFRAFLADSTRLWK